MFQGISLDGFPLALQFNKRDLQDVRPVEELDADLNVFRVPIFEAVATEGVGVQETLEGIVKLVMRSLRERYEGAAAEARSPGAADPAATMRSPLGSTPRTPGGGAETGPSPGTGPRSDAARPRQHPPAAAPLRRPGTAAGRTRTASGRPDAAPRRRSASTGRPRRRRRLRTRRPGPRTAGGRHRLSRRRRREDAGLLQDAQPTPAAPEGPAKGFEDEVSTAVYDVGDEIQIGPDDFSGPAMDGDVFASPGPAAFVDEVTKTDVEDVMGEPPVRRAEGLSA